MGIAGVWAGIVTILVFFLSLLTWGSTISGWVYARLLGIAGMRILGIRVEVAGLENLPTEASVLLVNHQSNLDAYFLGAVYPRKTVILAKRQMLKVPLFGIILLAARTILVDREDTASAKKALKDSTRAIKEDRNNLWIFPEGTRSRGRGLGEFKKGAFVMAIAAQAPIVSIVNQPIEHLVDPQAKFLKSGVHHVTVLPPIPTAGLKLRDADALALQVRQSFEQEIAKFPSN